VALNQRLRVLKRIKAPNNFRIVRVAFTHQELILLQVEIHHRETLTKKVSLMEQFMVMLTWNRTNFLCSVIKEISTIKLKEGKVNATIIVKIQAFFQPDLALH
jgi:hypothetical protein